ncbi:MAG: LacI family DNA-binding transcriptional regulator [Fodinibius sp.]|nr:LacI family DNA-binding transcriptional regulator [Fodinibius sp.]
MKKKATIREVAKRVGVSTATVSRVLNDSPHVTDETKQKILDAMEDLNYAPRITARKLASGSPQMLAIVVPSFTTPYFNEVLKGIKDEIAKTDIDMMMYNTGSRNPEAGMKQFFDRGMADAVIILSIGVSDKVHKQLQATKTTTVLVNTSRPEYNYFQVNDYRGGYLAGTHLVEQGFKEIGIITAAKDPVPAVDRRRGFTEALQEHGLSIPDDMLVRGDSTKHGGFSEEGGFEAIEKFAEAGHFPEAIFCLSDSLAIGAMYALSQMDMKVPEDIAIMGYDNIKLSKYHDLTTIDQNMYTIGVKTIKRLNELIDKGDESVQQETFDPQLVARGSTTKNG